jgi:NTP pyrophosphatase (non-canonical NTP hydrolase)
MTKQEFIVLLSTTVHLPDYRQAETLIQKGVRFEDSLFPSVDTELLNRAIDTYGTNAQIDKAIEEMGELIQALLKERHSRVTEEHNISLAHVEEELTDVYIMLSQLMIIFRERYKAFDNESVQSMANYKIERLRKRL